MAYYSKTRIENVAENILSLTYMEMMSVGEALRESIAENTTVDINAQPSIEAVSVGRVLSGWAAQINLQAVENKKKVEG